MGNEFYKDMGFRIRQMRQINRHSQSSLAENIGVVRQTLLRYEEGEIKIPADAIGKCAKTLNTPVGYFFGEGDQHPLPANTNRIGLLVSAEIMALPNENLQNRVYHLVRSINEACEEKNDEPS